MDSKLVSVLSEVYTPAWFATMVVSRYAQTPVIKEYAITISEAIEAHLLGLDHIAVAGLMPIIEGAIVKLGLANGISARKTMKQKVVALTTCAIEKNRTKKLGDYEEVDSMLRSFMAFLETFFYENSERYPLPDKTNRNGILHGAYADIDYGHPINFYKTLTALNMLCWISEFNPFAPKNTPESQALAAYYLSMIRLRPQVKAGCHELIFGATSEAR